jgi:hypothetical protein
LPTNATLTAIQSETSTPFYEEIYFIVTVAVVVVVFITMLASCIFKYKANQVYKGMMQVPTRDPLNTVVIKH